MNETRTGRRTTQEWLEEIGSNVRARRIEAGVTQEELARRAGLGLGALKHLESGAGANLTTLVKVVRALGADEWLSALAPPPEPTVSPMQLLRERRRVAPVRQRVRKAGR
jgi:transcriptional regulator with XRE-family HTH domain